MKNDSLSPTRLELILGLIYFLFQLFALPVLLTLVRLLTGYTMTDAVYNFVYFAVNFTATTIIFRKLLLSHLRRAAEDLFLCLRTAGIGFLANYVLTFAVGILVIMIDPDFTNVNDQNVTALTQSNFPLMAVGAVLLAPVAEELLFRGLLFGSLHRWSRVAAYGVSAVLFSFVHLISYIFYYDFGTLALCFLQYIPASLCLAWAYERSGTIVTPILIHIAVNQVSIQLMR